MPPALPRTSSHGPLPSPSFPSEEVLAAYIACSAWRSPMTCLAPTHPPTHMPSCTRFSCSPYRGADR